MKLDEFLDKYLPNNKELWLEVKDNNPDFRGITTMLILRNSFNNEVFSLAIKEFFQKVCEEQKAECMRQISCKYMNSVNVYKEPPSLDMLEQAINEAPLPTRLLAT
mgnify:CR=1 FL=1